jgi:hypothetical protein
MLQSVIQYTLIIVLQLGFYYHANFKSIALSHSNVSALKPALVFEETPVLSPQDIIFEVKHSKSPNVVVYQANRTLKNMLDPEKPIDVYWLMNTKGKKTENITIIEWRLAFGYKLIPIIKGKKYKIALNAIKDREITICQEESGKVDAYMMINGVYSKLSGVFIDFEYSFYLPKVNFVEFTGYAVSNNKKYIERISADS